MGERTHLTRRARTGLRIGLWIGIATLVGFGLKFGVGVVSAATYVGKVADKPYVNTTVKTEIECHRKNDVHDRASNEAAKADVMDARFKSLEKGLSEVQTDTREMRTDLREIRTIIMQHPGLSGANP